LESIGKKGKLPRNSLMETVLKSPRLKVPGKNNWDTLPRTRKILRNREELPWKYPGEKSKKCPWKAPLKGQ